MDLCAELTLHVVRFLEQGAGESPFSGRWSFVPSLQTATWPEAQRLLAGARKPLIVAPLLEPGFLGTWTVDSLHGQELAAANHQLSNQQKYFEAKIGHFALDDTDSARFSGGETSLSFLVSDLRRWLLGNNFLLFDILCQIDACFHLFIF